MFWFGSIPCLKKKTAEKNSRGKSLAGKRPIVEETYSEEKTWREKDLAGKRPSGKIPSGEKMTRKRSAGKRREGKIPSTEEKYKYYVFF